MTRWWRHTWNHLKKKAMMICLGIVSEFAAAPPADSFSSKDWADESRASGDEENSCHRELKTSDERSIKTEWKLYIGRSFRFVFLLQQQLLLHHLTIIIHWWDARAHDYLILNPSVITMIAMNVTTFYRFSLISHLLIQQIFDVHFLLHLPVFAPWFTNRK